MAKKSALHLLAGARNENESDRAVQGCNDYLRMGTGRSFSKLLEKYTKTHKSAPPTDSEDTIKKWSSEFNWMERASTYDAAIEERKNEAREKELSSGLALDFERVRKLKKLAAMLGEQIYEEGEEGDGALPNVWLADVKQIGSGEYAERVDLVRFNAPLISEFRAALDDLAKEVGGRKSKTELSGTVKTVGVTLEQWKAEREKRRAQASANLAIFEDD